MRTLAFVALLTVSLFAGCFGGGGGSDDDFHVTCANGSELHSEDFPGINNTTELLKKCPPKTGGNSTSSSTSRAANVLPTASLTSKADDGTVTDTTVLLSNLTFSGAGSKDPDGNITGMAMSVTDSNQTRTFQLYDPVAKTFPDVTVTFDRAGRATIVVALVDDRGGFDTIERTIFVDDPQPIEINTMSSPTGVPANTAAGSEFPECEPPLDGPTDGNGALLDNTYWADPGFKVDDSATWIEASVVSGEAYIAICPPPASGTAMISTSRSDTRVETDDAKAPFPAFVGVDGYFLGVYKLPGNAPNTPINVLVTVHFGPKPAA